MTKKNIRVTQWILLIAVVFAFTGISTKLMPMVDTEIETLVSYLIVIAFALVVLYWRKIPINYILPYGNGTNLKNVLLIIGIFITTTPLTTTIYYATNQLFPEVFNQTAMLSDEATNGLLYMIVASAITPAIGEEFFCRGLVYGSLRQTGHVKMAIIVSAMFFGFMHMNFTQFFYAFAMGIILATELEKTGCIWLPMLHHFLNNSESPFEIYLKDDHPAISNAMQSITSLDYSGHFLLSAVVTVVSTALLVFFLSKLTATPNAARARTEMDNYIKKDRVSIHGHKPSGISPMLVICFVYFIVFTFIITYTGITSLI